MSPVFASVTVKSLSRVLRNVSDSLWASAVNGGRSGRYAVSDNRGNGKPRRDKHKLFEGRAKQLARCKAFSGCSVLQN